MIIDLACWERGCPCYDGRTNKDGIEVIRKDWNQLTEDEIVFAAQSAGFGRKDDYLIFNDNYVALMSAIKHLVKNVNDKLMEKNT